MQRDVEELHKKATVLGRELNELKFNPVSVRFPRTSSASVVH